MKTKFLLFCLLFALCSHINIASAQVNKQDSLALVDLYNSTDGPHWIDHTNWLTSKPVESWYGVVVINHRVWDIFLFRNGLRGYIPASLGNIVNLYDLDLFL